jgi:hypothetical protein
LPRAAGPDFEEMMRQKQRDNPQFMFLHPSGAHNGAYRGNMQQMLRHPPGAPRPCTAATAAQRSPRHCVGVPRTNGHSCTHS